MASTGLRSLIKGISWEFFSFMLTTMFLYLVYGNLLQSFKWGFILSVIKISFFFLHERVWKKIRWGKYHIINGEKVWD